MAEIDEKGQQKNLICGQKVSQQGPTLNIHVSVKRDKDITPPI